MSAKLDQREDGGVDSEPSLSSPGSSWKGAGIREASRGYNAAANKAHGPRVRAGKGTISARSGRWLHGFLPAVLTDVFVNVKRSQQ